MDCSFQVNWPNQESRVNQDREGLGAVEVWLKEPREVEAALEVLEAVAVQVVSLVLQVNLWWACSWKEAP